MIKVPFRFVLVTSTLLFLFTIVRGQNSKNNTTLTPIKTPLKKESPRITAAQKPIGVKTTSISEHSDASVGKRSNYYNLEKEIISRSITGQIPSDFPKHISGQSKSDYLSVIKDWVKKNPNMVKQKSPINTNISTNNGIRGTEVIGEGRYLNFDKEIIKRSVTGEIPSDFPKHIIGQSKADYIIVMNEWVKNNPSKVKPRSYYLEYDALIKSMTIDGKIPSDFPKHSNNQTRQQYLQVMKNWAKQNISRIKPEYWSTINK